MSAACTSSDDGGAVALSFGSGDDTGSFDTSPADAGMIAGTFSASADAEGVYTLTTSIPSGSPIATCLVAVDGGVASTSVQIDASTSAVHALTAQIGVGAGYQGQGVCNVTALNTVRPNEGNEVIIVVSGAAG
ncbi:MAG TPA: hypothetical protein VGG28_02650 [Kofleriaceae bacterium]